MFLTSVLLLLLAQAPAVPVSPTYFVSSGASYNRYSTSSPNAAGWLSGAIKLGGNSSSTYSITTIDLTGTSASLRTGIATILAQDGGFSLLAHADGGVTTGAVAGATASTALGSFSGGAIITYDLGSLFKGMKNKGIFALGVVRIVSISSTSIQPIFEFGFGKKF